MILNRFKKYQFKSKRLSLKPKRSSKDRFNDLLVIERLYLNQERNYKQFCKDYGVQDWCKKHGVQEWVEPIDLLEKWAKIVHRADDSQL